MIRIFETLLHMYYQLHVKKEQLRSQKNTSKTKKKYFKNKMGLIVTFPNPDLVVRMREIPSGDTL